ncbi:TetR/AcrR family transcriptional regulator [Saccharopolyspora shandongensis]|uniref:TetR/AcrR family transcriptional regulator n=1 Tax=Saccharopolyspora shandongensis TaxID=418495 RepID=UPI0033CF9804
MPDRGRKGRAADIRNAALELFVRRGYEATTMADIGAAVGIRGASLYKHVASKQELLATITTNTMEQLLERHRLAVADAGSPVERLRRAVDAHVRYHARHRREAFVGNRELRSLVEPYRVVVLGRRAEYANCFEDLIADGISTGDFRVGSARLAAYAILDLGMGVAVWFREDSGPTENEVAWQHTEFALRMVGARDF